MESEKISCGDISIVSDGSPTNLDKEDSLQDKNKDVTNTETELNEQNENPDNMGIEKINPEDDCHSESKDAKTDNSKDVIDYLDVDADTSNKDNEIIIETHNLEVLEPRDDENIINPCHEDSIESDKEVNSDKGNVLCEDNNVNLKYDQNEMRSFNGESNINSNVEGTLSEVMETDDQINKMPALVNCDNAYDDDIKELSENVELVEDPIAYEIDAADSPVESDIFLKDDDNVQCIEEDSGNKNNDTADDKNVPYVITTSKKEERNICMICKEIKLSKYYAAHNDDIKHLCSNMCLDTLKESYSGNVITSDIRVKKFPTNRNIDNVDTTDFQRRCSECNTDVELQVFAWETMDFCTKSCLAKYQKRIGSQCAHCNKTVLSNLLGKYCVRFGCILRQFCSSCCLESYKKMLKVCSFCQEDMGANKTDAIAKLIKGTKRHFCSLDCCQRYCSLHEKSPKKVGVCRVCREMKNIEVEYVYDNDVKTFCSDPCFVAFKFVNKTTTGMCSMCTKHFNMLLLKQHAMFYDNNLCHFCSKTCKNIYTIAHRRIVPCSWCKVKKYNFDMIQTTSKTGESLTLCCLNCLSFLEVSDTAINSRDVSCDNCGTSTKSLYHLTMSDASIRNFCTYECVMLFQTQFAKEPIVLPDQYLLKNDTQKQTKTIKKKKSEHWSQLPIITNVVSLAHENTNDNDSLTNNNFQSSFLKKILILKKPTPPLQRNICTMTRPVVKDAVCENKPELVNKECQTDEVEKKHNLTAIPVPIYIPSPMTTFRTPFPIPVPFMLPIQIPMLVPVTKNTSNNVLKEVKTVPVKGPSDPFEAELLMMAELVASNNKKDESPIRNDDAGQPDEGGDYSPEPMDTANSFGDDVLQIAFNMTSDYEEPAVDLEGALTANTITASQSNSNPQNQHENVPIASLIIPDRSVRARRKYTRGRTTGKRGRRPYNNAEVQEVSQNTPPPPPPEPIEKPDANMCLKYTFGVNAWKQWVTTKNAELEKCSRRPKLFKTEILQLTSDELNYSLCLFVKEVRKPNGAEYAPDTIYYLCLGIQQYLYENGRIDNIFCDAYYEKFTDCLDEVCKKFSALYNESHYIVTRVEEEHLWESKQLGAHSPHVLLSTLMFFNTKHFNLTTVDEHMQLSFSHIMKHWKRNPSQAGGSKSAVSRNVLLRFYPPQAALEGNNKKRRVYEQQENEDNPLRCPVKLYEFYLSKCPESVKTRNDVFYLLPERSCVPDSPVWYSTSALGRIALEKMLHRVKMVKEVNVAVLTA